MELNGSYISFSKRLLITPAPLAIVSSCLLAKIRKGVEDSEGSAMSVYRKLEREDS